VIDPGELPEEQAADVTSNEAQEPATRGKERFFLASCTSTNSSWLENDHDNVDANVATAEVDVAASEGMYTFDSTRIPSYRTLIFPEYPVHTDDTVHETDEYKEEGAPVADETEYVDDENEWDDLGYSADPDNIQEDSTLAGPTSPHQIDSNAVHETKSPDVPWDGNVVREAHAELTPPQRKRSFSEVEAEPEGDLTLCESDLQSVCCIITDCVLAPGSKKPRHL
jgi:hypothetical protein